MHLGNFRLRSQSNYPMHWFRWSHFQRLADFTTKIHWLICRFSPDWGWNSPPRLSSRVTLMSQLLVTVPGAKQSDPYKAFPGTFMLTTAISKVALDVVKNVEIICWGWKSSRVIRNCQSRRGEEEKHGPSLLVGIIVHCTFQQEAYSKNIHWNLMDIYIYWLMVWNMFFIFPYLGIIIPTDQYFSGGLKPPTSISMSFIPHLPGERLDSSDTLSLSLCLSLSRSCQIEC